MKAHKVDSKKLRVIRFVPLPSGFTRSITITHKSEQPEPETNPEMEIPETESNLETSAPLEPMKEPEVYSETDAPSQPEINSEVNTILEIVAEPATSEMEDISDTLTEEVDNLEIEPIQDGEEAHTSEIILTNIILTKETPNENVPQNELPDMPAETIELSTELPVSNGVPIETIYASKVVPEPAPSDSSPELLPQVLPQMPPQELPELVSTPIIPEPNTIQQKDVASEIVPAKFPIVAKKITPLAPKPAQQSISENIIEKKSVADLSEEKNFSDELTRLIKKDWRYNAWGYVPASVITKMAGTNKQFKHKIIKDEANFKNSYIIIISPKGEVETERIGIQ